LITQANASIKENCSTKPNQIIVCHTAEVEIASLEKALANADNRLIDLEAANKNVGNERDRYKTKMEELEKLLEDAHRQMELNATLLADSQSTAVS